MKLLMALIFLFYIIYGVTPLSANLVKSGNVKSRDAGISLDICLNPQNNCRSNPNLISDFQFQPFNSITLSKETRHWLRITINNDVLTEKENYLYFHGIFAEAFLWQKDNNKKWVQHSTGGYDIPYSQRSGHGTIDDKLLFYTSSETKTELLVSVYQPYVDIILKDQYGIISKSKFEKENTLNYNLQFWFAGIISVLCIFSLILFLFMRNRAFIIYTLYAIITEIYFLAFFNIIEANLLFDYPQINKYLFFCITLSQSLYFLFLNVLLKQIDGIKKQKFVTKYAFVSFSVALLIILFSLFSYTNAIHLSDIYTIVNVVVGLYIIAITYKDAPRRIRIIYIGFITILFSGLLALFLNSISLDNAFIYIYQLGFLIELTFFFVAISYTYFIEKTSRIQTMLNLSVVEAKKLKTEKEALELKAKVDEKNRNLTLKAVEILKNNQVINEVIDKLIHIEKKKIISKNDVTLLKNTLKGTLKYNHWKEFELYFTEVHPHFYDALNKKYPNLTPGEAKLCAYIKLNFSTKEIALITGRTIASINVSRSRLRKKMKVQNSENLYAIVASI